MLQDERGHHFPVGGQGTDSGFFILAHEATVADDIGAEDGREFALHAYRRSRCRHHFIPLAGDYPAPTLYLSIRKGNILDNGSPHCLQETPILGSGTDGDTKKSLP